MLLRTWGVKGPVPAPGSAQELLQITRGQHTRTTLLLLSLSALLLPHNDSTTRCRIALNRKHRAAGFITVLCVSHSRKSILRLHRCICCPQIKVSNAAKHKAWPSDIPLTRVALAAPARSPLPLSVPRAPSVGNEPQELQSSRPRCQRRALHTALLSAHRLGKALK